MTDFADQVRAFHRAFDLPISKVPSLPSPALAGMRLDIMIEEVKELRDAVAVGDLVGIADALADIVYVAHGTALTYGIDLPACLAEVHRSNMSKLGLNGKPLLRGDGKVLKGPNYSPPNIASLLVKQ